MQIQDPSHECPRAHGRARAADVPERYFDGMAAHMEHFKFVSENTVDRLSLHDCDCARLYFNEGRLIFKMEWMEILSGHPDNPYDKAHQSTEGQIDLINPVVEDCVLLPWDAEGKPQMISSMPEIDVRGFGVLDFTEEKAGGCYKLYLFGEFNSYEQSSEYGFIKMNVRYTSSAVMFDKLCGESWFEAPEFRRPQGL